MIRPAQESDLRRLTELAEVYHSEHWFGEHTEFDAEYTFNNFRSFHIGMIANIIVAHCEKCNQVVGFCIAVLVPLNWSPKVRCTIGYSYLDPAHRKDGLFGEMVQAQTDWAADKGCVDINLGDGAQYGGKFTSVCKGLGFTKTGTDSYKVLVH
tara:strand:+ start:846 stop:1304 length:459 start_codon:yes stop_codon:yes gene_type:complete